MMMRAWVAILRLFLAGFLLATVPGAQTPEFERIPVRVTAFVAGNVYLDHGREAGIEPGDTVRLEPLGGGTVIATVRSVSRSSARGEIVGDEVEIEIGTEGVVLVPRERLSREAPDGPEPRRLPPDATTPPSSAREDEPIERHVPDHPEWEHPPVEWDADVPLLAPVDALTPEKRERRVRGRLQTQFHLTSDRGGEDREYRLSRTGVDLLIENPFRRGGELDLDVELYHRSARIDGDEDDSEGRLRPDRASYRWGGIRGRPHRWEAGRFLQHEFPEFGVIDGVEYGRRFASGNRWGASIGWLPSRTDEMETGDDLQTSLFYRFVSGEEERLALGAGYQKTWHEGEADRDLFVGSFDYRPSRRWYARATAWVDWYTSSDELKSGGLELTQLHANANYLGEGGHGVGVFASRIRWPELLRNEFDELTAQQIADNETDRLGVTAWRRLRDDVRLHVRVDRWRDQDDGGGSGEVRMSFRDLLYDDGEVTVGLHRLEGKYRDGTGWRLRADRRFAAGFLVLGWDGTEYETNSDVAGSESLLQHVFRASYDVSLGRGWDLSLYFEDRQGDEQDSLTGGFHLQKRL